MFIFLCFPFFVFNRKTLFFPLKKAILVYLALFLFSLFWTSPFFSFSFFVSLSCSFLSSLLPVFHFCFWFLLFLSVYLFFSFKLFFCFFFFFCLLSCFVLNHKIWFVFALHRVFLLCLFYFIALVFCYFFDFWKPIKNISETNGNSKNSNY